MVASANFTNRGLNNTAFSPNADKVAQITGSGQTNPGNPNKGGISPTYAATVSLDPFIPYTGFINLTTTAAGNATLTVSTVPPAGARLVIQINNDAGGARTITFGTGFRSTGTLVGTASDAYLLEFVSDGTTYNELSRSVGPV